ncbi:MAG: hypothetical protein FD123_2334 [Bacteroidetes bacterium]|nr:MAG: hypothetical protein FD123_2334 [Bacteroidota bacterium]
MKNLPLFVFCLFLYLGSAAQAQLTNTGNLKLHAGAAVTFLTIPLVLHFSAQQA